MERVQTRPAPGVLCSRPGRRSLGLVERGGRRQGSRLRCGQGRESEREGEGPLCPSDISPLFRT